MKDISAQILATYQISLALIEGPDSVVQLLYGNRHSAPEVDSTVRCAPRPSIDDSSRRDLDEDSIGSREGRRYEMA